MPPKKSASAPLPRPALGSTVHYVSHGSPDGTYGSECRAALVAAVPAVTRAPASRGIDVMVINPTGIFFKRVLQDDSKAPGTWHYDCANAPTPTPDAAAA